MRKIKTFWFIRYNNQGNIGRTTETKLFNRLKDAVEFSETVKEGYIMKQDVYSWYGTDMRNTMIKMFGGFEPSATEGMIIKNLLKEN